MITFPVSRSAPSLSVVATVSQDYAYSRGNFAFSPYGVASVLVVLFEGARGDTARQVHTTLKLPWDRDVLRVGFRDVHRNLRVSSPEDQFLAGIPVVRE